MKTSIDWLQRYIDIPWTPRELAEKLTLAGLEVEGIFAIGALPDTVVVGRILERSPHPNADKLSVCAVDAGRDAPLQIVCGAPNCDAGRKVPVALPGTKLAPDFTIKKAKLRGVASEGMLCAADELGLGGDHSGLLILPGDAEIGTPVQELFPPDTVIDWEVTPNRPDWLSHFGIAREIAAVRRQPEALRPPPAEFAENAARPAADLLDIEIAAPDLCPRYTARVIENVSIGPSPEWMQRALEAVGVRPINNVVDITNYVMLECGQPLHAFDYDRIAGSRIVVRRATPGETMVTLDGESHELTPDNLLICDGERGVALAGVMGGENSEISAATTTVLLESAAFEPGNIRATARALGLGTESSYRFERGVDIEMTAFASQRAAALIAELAGGNVCRGMLDACAAPYVPRRITCRFERVRALLGIDIANDEILDCFRALGLDLVAKDAEAASVTIPSFRLDLEREVDLIEEVARLHGLENIPAAPERAQVGGARADDQYYPLEEARNQLRALGLDETMTYSFVNPEAATRCTGFTREQLILPVNPLSRELGAMRPTLVPGILQTAAHNIAHNRHDLHFFELGRVLARAPGYPEERTQVAIIMSGRRQPERFGTEKNQEIELFDLKGTLESWFETRRLEPECEAGEHPAMSPGTVGVFSLEDKALAWFGRVCEELTRDMRLKHPLFLALVELDRVLHLDAAPMLYRPLPQFPAVGRDISFIAPPGTTHKMVTDAIRETQIAEIESIELFDVYEDEKNLGRNRVSLAYSITYRDPRKTLTDKKVNALHERVRQHLARKLGVELR